jgi:hypothetical protein
MARRRLIIHGSQEEMEMFEPIYNTRLRLQHGASTSRFQLPDPPPSAESQQEGEDSGAVVQGEYSRTPDQEGSSAAAESVCCRGFGDEENDSPDAPHSATLTEDRAGLANNDTTGVQQGT